MITTVIINFKTPKLVQRAVVSFRNFYPTVHLLLLENGSNDESVDLFHHIRHQFPKYTDLLINKRNRHHGPAMDQALYYLRSTYVLFLDSDCEVRKGGLIEAMLSILEDRLQHYIIGKKIFMNKRGFDVEKSENAFQYIRPFCMMVKRELYLQLPKFRRHGTPCLDNMVSAVNHGYALIDFPVDDYVYHAGRGTASKYGYHLGWQGKWDYVMNKLGL